MPHELKELEKLCQEIGQLLGHAVDGTFGKKQVGFVFMLFDFGPQGHMTYLSNADRNDMIRALQETITVLQTSRAQAGDGETSDMGSGEDEK